MLRSRRNNSRSLIEMIRDNPFLCAAFLSGLALFALLSNVGSPSILNPVWDILGFGFQLTAGWPERVLPGAPKWMLLAAAGVIGLIPYLIADVVWRHIRNR
ncbi:MAG: hypothetical protein GVY32_08430 [Gammaproteobacteria bacterium]|jgi:hypothetical protein|nr:hypothetical protein [Gammaproteobacteria bacterium]